MAWMNTGRNGWFEDWFTRYSKTIEILDEDRTGHHWRENTTGNEIALVSDGGWRMTLNREPYMSRYRAFLYLADVDQVIEQQHLLEETSHQGHFNPDETGAGRYSQIRRDSVNAIDAALRARQGAAAASN
ncbi:hypothetical protein [Nesterenkonia halotolerans]|uniref:Uncharacterized protein n=1 Tax=Nesterenkonia halotolerans TaxID=225325 RepID=A0ABR9J861_9MICC|nr:hypothetical protein [Nesterenkonia halotolerans]MBE1515181.1 hypothetical protein [Nesterenkonia halotolerans]